MGILTVHGVTLVSKIVGRVAAVSSSHAFRPGEPPLTGMTADDEECCRTEKPREGEPPTIPYTRAQEKV